MSKNFIRKIVSALFFLLSLFLLWQIFLKTSQDIDNHKTFILFGALALSVLFLFVLVFTMQTDIIYEKEKSSLSEEEKNISQFDEDIKSLTEEKIKNIIASLKKGSIKESLSEEILKLFAKEFYIVQGIVYVKHKDQFKVSAGYAVSDKKKINEFSEGQGIPGQVAKDRKIKRITEIPEDYIQIVSGLGAASPRNIIFIPIIFENETVALIEAAAFDEFPDDIEKFHPDLNNALAENFKLIKNGK